MTMVVDRGSGVLQKDACGVRAEAYGLEPLGNGVANLLRRQALRRGCRLGIVFGAEGKKDRWAASDAQRTPPPLIGHASCSGIDD